MGLIRRLTGKDSLETVRRKVPLHLLWLSCIKRERKKGKHKQYVKNIEKGRGLKYIKHQLLYQRTTYKTYKLIVYY